MNDRFAVAANRGSIRIYQYSQPVGQTTLGLISVHSVDVPLGRTGYQDTVPYQAGRHPSYPQSGALKGMSIDERLPGQEEQEKRAVEEVVRQIESFLSGHPAAEWDFAAPPGVHQAVLDKVAPAYRQRLRRAMVKDLTNMPVAELRQHLTS